MTSGQYMPKMDLNHLLTEDCSLLEVAFVAHALHVPEPYRRTDFTLVLNIRRVVFLNITFDLHTGIRIVDAVLAFPISPECPDQIHYSR